MSTSAENRTKGVTTAEIAAELAKLSPFERAVAMAKVERHKAQQLAKASTNTRRRSLATWGTPLDNR